MISDNPQVSNHFALLAPVPIMHLKSAEESKMDNVAFGTSCYEFIHDTESLRPEKQAIPIYIYASWLHTDKDEVKIVPPSITWKAHYIGYLDPDKPQDRQLLSGLRPPSTKDKEGKDKEGWGVCWVVKNLMRLDKPFPICKLRGRNQRGFYKDIFIPESPLLIEYPGI